MGPYARQLEFAEESDPAARDLLAKRNCAGWAVASEEYRENLKKLYAELGSLPLGGGAEVAELREEKWDRVLAALLRAAGKRRGDALRAPKNAKWKVRIARERRSLDRDKRLDRSGLAMGHPTRVCNLIRGNM